ncbi:MAG: dihydroorotate dehydrogenase (quinone) [Bifidobacteriaceae bacterium]|jgi:dihydroorotate dehydrogenase (fumarate)|nr:dihydroorotate dehydrogenase (quinone) [Bifidobacteriaceae bacterium]
MNLFLTKLFDWSYLFVVKKIVFNTPPDKAHDQTLKFAKWSGKIGFLQWLLRVFTKYEKPELETNVMGIDFKNPIGLGAGLDKNAAMGECLENCGFGHATFGSITGRQSIGNPKPWFHRLPKYQSMMVWVGLANKGVDELGPHIANCNDKSKTMNVCASIARTNDKLAADETEGIADYVKSFVSLKDSVKFIEVNISCPNTFKGEPFTTPKSLDKLLSELDKVERSIPITLKMPQDKTDAEFKELLDVILKHNVQGVTIANLRKDREGLEVPTDWNGNLSGTPTHKRALELVTLAYEHTHNKVVSESSLMIDGKNVTPDNGKLAIIGLGGVMNSDDAYEFVKAGADLVEFVSALMYKGPAVVSLIKRGLVKSLKADGFANIKDAVGSGVSGVSSGASGSEDGAASSEDSGVSN